MSLHVLTLVLDLDGQADEDNVSKEALSDAFDAGINDDNLALIYEANEEVLMAVNTPSGLTKRESLSDVILQSDVWSSLSASVQVDNICKDIESSGYGYKYKGVLPISMLALVDDLIGITYAGFKAHQMNIAINVKTAEKILQFGVSKCKIMLIDKNSEKVFNNPLKVEKLRVDITEEKEKRFLLSLSFI